MDEQNLNSGAQQAQMMQQQKMIKEAATVECDNCGAKLFDEKLIFKRMSPLVTQSGEAEYVPMKVWTCASCGKVPREIDSEGLIPEELKAPRKTE